MASLANIHHTNNASLGVQGILGINRWPDTYERNRMVQSSLVSSNSGYNARYTIPVETERSGLLAFDRDDRNRPSPLVAQNEVRGSRLFNYFIPAAPSPSAMRGDTADSIILYNRHHMDTRPLLGL